MANEIVEVNAIRLRDRLSIPGIAREMGLERSTLQRVLKTPGRQPRDTTLYAIREWLEQRKLAGRRNARPRKRASARASV